MTENSAVLHGAMTRITRELEAQRSLINKLEKQIATDKKDTDKTIKRLIGEIDNLKRQGVDHNRKIIQIKQDAQDANNFVQRLASKR